MYKDPDDLEGLVSLVSSIPSGCTPFLPPLLQGSLKPKGKGLMEASRLRLSVPGSLILRIMSGYCCGYGIGSHLLREEAALMMAEQGTESTATSVNNAGVIFASVR